ncbi:MAG TPA: hypothetical protein VFN18_02515 [Solirubrobacterales bacterium]|nr:hypothetical protein [Solirubrobacterales bacterium]
MVSAVAIALVSAVGTGSALAADEFDRYGLEEVGVALSSVQAGEHADLTVSFKLTRNGSEPFAQTQNVSFKLPPGMIGNPQGIPRCTVGQLWNSFEESECPVDSQIGVTQVRVLNPISGTFSEPLYNMEPPEHGDVVARFGFFAGVYPALVNVRVDPTDYSVVGTVEGAPSAAGLLEATSTLWGVPAAPSHDEERITPQEAIEGGAPEGGREASIPEAPFLSNPTDCSLDRELTVTATSYQLPDTPSTMSTPFPKIGGCGKVEFEPRFSLIPTNPEAAAPTGVDSELVIPQDETPQGRATSTMRSARVSLPEGLAINPAAGDGLEACSAGQVGFGRNEPSHCPDGAKIGSVEVDVPALADTLHGAVYQRTPEVGNLFQFWVVTDEQGVHLKLPAKIEANRETGQVTTIFNGIDKLGGLPQVPFSSLRLNVFGGPRAPLATPPTCGTYRSTYSFTPWSGKPAVSGSTPMEITQGCGKGGFSPGLSAGSMDSAAGQFSPFVFSLTRKDGEDSPQSIALHLPQGLLAKLSGVPLCPEADAASGSCPNGSRIGSLSASSGVGGAPLWIPQPGKAPTAVYLAGPYSGAPYSVVSVVPAQAGPFDLGVVVNRAAIYVDPDTALATIVTDPLPQILEGVPVAYRTINVLVDRPNFTFNPTGCEAKRITATVTATSGALANPSDGFQATDCARLGFRPKLSLRLKGPTRRAGNPALRAVLAPRAGDANPERVSVALPHSEFLDQGHIRTICTRVQFNAGAGNGASCPADAVYGHAKAWSPILSEPLEGPVFLRSNGGEHPLPDLVLALHGQIDFNAVGRIDSVNGGIRNTFDFVPDAPISKVVVDFQGGKKGLLQNSTNLCVGKHRAKTKYTAHSGKEYKAKVALKATGCKAHHKRHRSAPAAPATRGGSR